MRHGLMLYGRSIYRRSWRRTNTDHWIKAVTSRRRQKLNRAPTENAALNGAASFPAAGTNRREVKQWEQIAWQPAGAIEATAAE